MTIFLALTACNFRSDNKSIKDITIDTTKSFRLGKYWVTPKKSFEIISLEKSSGNTLHLVTCSDFVYFPFGKLKDKSSLTSSLLKDFTIKSYQIDTFTNTNISPPFFQWSEKVDLELSDNKLKVFFDNDPEASTHGYIRGGEIVDNKVTFLNNIKVGMNEEDFFKRFFVYVPTELTKKYTVVQFESCVLDITHIYTFENGLLSSIKFISQ